MTIMKMTYQKPALDVEYVRISSSVLVASPDVKIGDGEVDPEDLDAKADNGWDNIWGNED